MLTQPKIFLWGTGLANPVRRFFFVVVTLLLADSRNLSWRSDNSKKFLINSCPKPHSSRIKFWRFLTTTTETSEYPLSCLCGDGILWESAFGWLLHPAASLPSPEPRWKRWSQFYTWLFAWWPIRAFGIYIKLFWFEDEYWMKWWPPSVQEALLGC